MANNIKNDGTGGITTEHTVWCGYCAEWYQEPSWSIARFIKRIRELGWRKKKRYWCCLNCQDKK